MNSTEDNLPARAAVAIGDLVGTTGLDGHGRNAHQIDAGVVKANSVTQMFLNDENFVLGRSNRRQQLERGALDLARARPGAGVRIRIDQLDFHATHHPHRRGQRSAMLTST